MVGDGLGKSFSAEWMSCRLRRDQGRSFLVGWEVAEMSDGVSAEVLQQVWFGTGWRALGEAGADSSFGAGVAEKQVLDYLLDAPVAGTRGWAELGLRGVEAVEGVGELVLEALEIVVHWHDYLTRLAGMRLVPC